MPDERAQSANIELAVAAEEAGERLDLFLRARLHAASRHLIRTALREGRVGVNGAVVRTGVRLAAGDRVSVPAALDIVEVIASPDLPLVVQYESAACVVVDKRAPQACAPLTGVERDTLVNALVARYPEVREVGYRRLEPGLLHRLDNETSGLVIAARTTAAFRVLQEQADAGEIVKVYLAAVAGRPPPRGTIELAIAHDARDPARMCVVGEGGTSVASLPQAASSKWRGTPRAAKTDFRVIADNDDAALLEVVIRKGARHQIRVHLAAAGYPIIGDKLYSHCGDGGAGSPPRHFLHASKLIFIDPSRDTPVTVSSPLPSELLRWLDAFGIEAPA